MSELIKKYLESGGTITRCPPSNKRPEPRRYAYSISNRGNQKLKLRGTL